MVSKTWFIQRFSKWKTEIIHSFFFICQRDLALWKAGRRQFLIMFTFYVLKIILNGGQVRGTVLPEKWPSSTPPTIWNCKSSYRVWRHKEINIYIMTALQLFYTYRYYYLGEIKYLRYTSVMQSLVNIW